MRSILFPSSLVQHECIPQAILGMDVICPAKVGDGEKRYVCSFYSAVIEHIAGQVRTCHVSSERISLRSVMNLRGSVPICLILRLLSSTVVSILAHARDKELSLKNVRHFILDECDKMLESLGREINSLHLVIDVDGSWVLSRFPAMLLCMSGYVVSVSMYCFLSQCFAVLMAT
ncbi:DEAD-box ATP-dependent RNA helicase 15 [Camellia lanceoleosa]|uniref:DEAD-box ATP-dependent RNA helicase 15 n=1 Tax=Camellia lanceoleosa TaxID=1840588 RepID=A0ACC0HJG7_9ERIC|nr:DEAD-box ATP-dependent RNA helicase 15 [Camellia lanceoleosa]